MSKILEEKSYDSILEMVRDTSDDPEFVAQFEECLRTKPQRMQNEIDRLQGIVNIQSEALESAQQFCKAIEREAPSPFNRTPLNKIEKAITAAEVAKE